MSRTEWDVWPCPRCGEIIASEPDDGGCDHISVGDDPAAEVVRVGAYPHPDGDFVVIGPECFAMQDGSVLSWRGENYTPQRPTLRVRLHNIVVNRRNRRAAAQNQTEPLP